jgi:hypothetical protein
MEVTARTGRAITQAGFPPRRPVFDSRSGHVGFVVDKLALGQFSSDYFGFPSQLSFHQILHTHLSSGAGIIGQLVADVPSGLIPSDEKKKRRKKPKPIILLRNLPHSVAETEPGSLCTERAGNERNLVCRTCFWRQWLQAPLGHPASRVDCASWCDDL